MTVAWSQLRQMDNSHHSAAQIERQKRRYERIRAGGLPEWQESGEWAGFKFTKPK